MDWQVRVRDTGAEAERDEGGPHLRREAARLVALRLVPSPRYDTVLLLNLGTCEVECLKEPVVHRPPSPLSQSNKVYRVAARLPQPFTSGQLVVAVWEADRATFGLCGYEQLHPDSNKVTAYLCGRRGLVAKGFLRKLAPCKYRVVEGIACG